MYFNDWLTVFIIGCFVVITPGPNMAIVIRNSLSCTRASGIYTAGGLALGNIVHITYCVAGIGVIISKSILVFNLIKWLGAGYLVYLGIKSLRAQPHPLLDQSLTVRRVTSLAAFRTGFLTDLLNPKATLFFLALFTQIVHPNTPLFAQIFYAITIVVLEFCFLAILAGVIGHQSVHQRLGAVSHWIERVTGTVLIALGMRVAFARSTQ